LRFLLVLSKIQYFHGEIFEELYGLSAENLFCDFLNSFLSSFPYGKLVLNLRNLKPKSLIIFEEKAVDNFQDIFEISTYGLLLYIQKLGNQKPFITTQPEKKGKIRFLLATFAAIRSGGSATTRRLCRRLPYEKSFIKFFERSKKFCIFKPEVAENFKNLNWNQ